MPTPSTQEFELNCSDVSGVTTANTPSTCFELGGDPLELGEVVALVELADVGAVGRAEQQDDRLATEVVLERDVVDGDLRVGVEVAVLSGGELDVARPMREHDA